MPLRQLPPHPRARLPGDQAVEEGRIALSRYESYLSMLEDKGESKYRE